MFRDSFMTDSGSKRLGYEMGDGQSGCTFWTRADGQMTVQLFRSLAHMSYHPHTHSEYVISVCLAGEVLRTQCNQTHVVRSGSAVISNFGVTHATSYRTRNSHYCETIGVAFDRRLLSTLARELSLPAADGNTCHVFTGSFGGEILQRCAQDIASELRQRQAGQGIILEALAMRLIGETLRAWPQDQILVATADSVARLSQRDFIRAYEFMRSCRKEAFRVEHLCSFLGSSEENFTRLFSASTSRPPANFYNQLLLQRGRELLQNSTLSIKEISFKLGFKTSSHFIVAFRREFAISPQKYRSQITPTNPSDRLFKSLA